jgi:4-hydroxy-tetrahydrodipicolinate reductase
VNRIQVIVVGPDGKALGKPVCSALLDPQFDFELCGGIVRTIGLPPTRNRDKLGGSLIADSFSSFGRECGVPKSGIHKVVVFYAVRTENVLISRLREAVQAGFRVHVIGTTGLSDNCLRVIRELTSENVVVLSPNFSMGVHYQAEQCARLAARFPVYEVEITEIHHHRKEDSPSGTALYWARMIANARGHVFEQVVKYGRPQGKSVRNCEEIVIHSQRYGDVPGSHQALFASGKEKLIVEHHTASRELFGFEALESIAWAHGTWLSNARLFQPPGGLTETEMSEKGRLAKIHRMCDVLDLPLLQELDV